MRVHKGLASQYLYEDMHVESMSRSALGSLLTTAWLASPKQARRVFNKFVELMSQSQSPNSVFFAFKGLGLVEIQRNICCYVVVTALANGVRLHELARMAVVKKTGRRDSTI